MTEGILYVLHGRRGKISKSNIELLQTYLVQLGVPSVISFLEGQQQTLEDGVRFLQDRVEQLTVVPVLLFSATHIRWDIPRRINAIIRSDRSFDVLKPLATTEAVFDYLNQQLQSAVHQFPNRKILIVAHGTPHFPEPYRQLTALGDRLQTAINVPILCANHIGHHLVKKVLAEENAPLIIQRLFLTDGRLANRIKKNVLSIQPDSIFLPTLEDQPVITAAISERLNQYRLAVNQ